LIGPFARRRALEIQNNLLRGSAQLSLAVRLQRPPGNAPDRAFKRIDEVRRDAPPEAKPQRPEACLRTQPPERRLVRDAYLDQHLR